MFQSYDHPQRAYIIPCQSYSLKTLSDLHCYVELVLRMMLVLNSVRPTHDTRHAATAPN